MAGVEVVRRPPALVIVALLFLIGGLAPITHEAQMSTAGLGLMELLLAIGLFMGKPPARRVALLSIYLTMAFVILIACVMLLPNTQPFVGVLSWQWWNAPKAVGLLAAMALFALLYWEGRVLERKEIRAFFGGEAT